MSIDFNDPGFYGLWFMPVNGDRNWLGALFERADGHEFVWRMRYKKDDRAFDSSDIRNWYMQKAPVAKSLEQVLEHVRMVVRVMSEHSEGEPFELLKGDKTAAQFVEELKKQPWAHWKFVQKRRV